MEKILLAVGKKSNRLLLSTLLRENYFIDIFSKKGAICPSYDLIIVDSKTIPFFLQNGILPVSGKNPVFQPILLITAKKHIPAFPANIWETADDLIITPVIEAELFARVESLLRARRQSLDLYKNMDTGNSIRYMDLFAIMSHEVKTPLAVLLSGIGLLENNLQKPGDTESSRQALKIARSNCLRLLRISNNILDLSMANAGCLKLHLQNIPLEESLSKIAEYVQPYAQQKKIQLQYIPGRFKGTVAADESKLARIMLNLLSNAIRFTPPGGKISVQTRLSRRNRMITIIVQDNGLGIPKEKQDIVFSPFIQGDDSLNKIAEGCGLGLALTKKLVELHGGSIRVQSRIGLGSKFMFDLPMRQITKAEGYACLYDVASLVTSEFSEL